MPDISDNQSEDLLNHGTGQQLLVSRGVVLTTSFPTRLSSSSSRKPHKDGVCLLALLLSITRKCKKTNYQTTKSNSANHLVQERYKHTREKMEWEKMSENRLDNREE